MHLLQWIATESGCEFRADIKWAGGQLDAAMWMKGHVALFEVSAGMLTDAGAYSGDPNLLGQALTQTLVRSTRNGEVKNEAVAQVARDAKALLNGDLAEHVPVVNVTSVYPVVITIDRRVRAPGLRFWFDNVFAPEVADVNDARVAPLAALGLEDVEAVEQLVREKHAALRGTPRGLLKLLRMWQLRRDKLLKSGKRAATWHHLIRDIGPPLVNDRLKEESDRWWNDVRAVFKDHPGEAVIPVDTN